MGMGVKNGQGWWKGKWTEDTDRIRRHAKLRCEREKHYGRWEG